MLITNEKTFFQCQVLRGLERSHCRATLVSHTMPTTKRSTAFMTDNGYIYDTCLRGDLPNKENFLVVCSMYSNKFHPDKGCAIKNLKKGKFGSIFPRGKYIILTVLWPYIQNSKGKVICKIIKKVSGIRKHCQIDYTEVSVTWRQWASFSQHCKYWMRKSIEQFLFLLFVCFFKSTTTDPSNT